MLPRRRSVRAAALALSVALLAGCTASVIDGRGSGRPDAAGDTPSAGRPSSSAPPGAAARQPPADFADCRNAFTLSSLDFPGDRESRLSFGCARIDVPLDYAKPGGRTITLQLVRIHDSANTDPTGSLLVNPGGPGASGVELAVGLSAELSDDVLKHFDVVGFDPRGVGLSTPVRCLTDAQKDALNAASPDVLTRAGFASAKRQAREVASACTARYGAALAQIDTTATARDMDRIRQAVGDERMNYLGFSYGTELGAQYAHLFPGRIRVAVLDGAVDPTTDDITSFANQLQGFEDAFDQFAKYCTGQPTCAAIGDPRRAVYRLAALATKSPIPSSLPGETRAATSSLVYTGILSALYSRTLWPRLGQAIAAGLRGDSQALLSLADRYNERSNGVYSNISDANTTIGCNDSRPGPSDATIRATARVWKTKYPIFGLWSAPALFTCQQWQPDRTPLPLPRARTRTPVLVVGNVNDPATPYQGAIDLARTMGNAEVLTWKGEGHTSYLQGSTCIDRHVDRYLVSGTLPPAGEVCQR